MSAAPIRIALIGMGKIARDQHVPAIAASDDFTLVATASPELRGIADVPHFNGLELLLRDGPALDAVALCTPPQVRHHLAATAIAQGLHVLLEKPPGATLGEVETLTEQARARGVTLFASWHSRFAGGVAPARAWLAERRVTGAAIVWREDVRVWHPGQGWIWQPGGLGVFDPGINALSIMTEILPLPLHLTDAFLGVPANRTMPIAADLRFRDAGNVPVTMDLDFRQTGPQSWDITVETDMGTLALGKGGAVLTLPSGAQTFEDREYQGLYAHFAALVRDGKSDVDVAPLRLVADAFLLARRETVEAFED